MVVLELVGDRDWGCGAGTRFRERMAEVSDITRCSVVNLFSYRVFSRWSGNPDAGEHPLKYVVIYGLVRTLYDCCTCSWTDNLNATM